MSKTKIIKRNSKSEITKSFRCSQEDIEKLNIISKHYKINYGDLFRMLISLGINKIEEDKKLSDIEGLKTKTNLKFEDIDNVLKDVCLNVLETKEIQLKLYKIQKRILLQLGYDPLSNKTPEEKQEESKSIVNKLRPRFLK